MRNMKMFFFQIMALALVLTGCSNDSGTTGPQVMPVDLTVTVGYIFHGVPNATVLVVNLKEVTKDTTGVVTFHTDINTLLPNHKYPISVIAPGLVQDTTEDDTVRVPNAPNTANGYDLQYFIHMKNAP